jgi:AraC-like DNA-binding protein
VLGVRLHPIGAWAVLGHPLHELTDRTTDLRDLTGNPAHELAERCHDASDSPGRVGRAIAWLSDRLAHAPNAPRSSPAVRWAADRIASECGAVRIEEVRAQTGLSARILAASFLEQVGVTPKRYARVHRFRRALGMLHAGSQGLASVALRAGYYDQPHMNAEFRQLAGLTPREFLAARRYPASTSTAES